MIRRMKDDVLSEIPKKVRHFVKISVDQEDKVVSCSILFFLDMFVHICLS